MAAQKVVIDACCTLNLLATKRALDIVRALSWQLLNTPRVAAEALFLWTAPDADGERSKEPTSIAELLACGHLTTHPLDSDALNDAFVEAAARITDSDASCIALAGVLGVPLLSDDRKERRIALELFPRMELISTLDMLHDAAAALSLSEQELSHIANAMRWGGNFAPPRQDPRAAWYASLLRTTSART